jgi:hypothetical protein
MLVAVVVVAIPVQLRLLVWVVVGAAALAAIAIVNRQGFTTLAVAVAAQGMERLALGLVATAAQA